MVFAAAIGAAIICDAHPSLHDVQQDRFGHDAPASAKQSKRRDSYGGALAECWATSKARIDVNSCLQEKLAKAQRDYEKIAVKLAAKLAELDVVTGGRYGALAAFREAQQKFQQYRDANCKSYAAEMASGTGAGDVREACVVDMTRARVIEMEKHLDPASQLL
jgi:uncharacterized protein YecT (DUF1311 family)